MKHALFFLACLVVLFTGFVPSALSNYASGNYSDAHSTTQKFSTPEQTWGIYHDALQKGDFDLAKKCCVGKTKHVAIFQRMQETKRLRILQNIKSLDKIHVEGDKAKYRLVKDLNGVDVTSYVYFARIDNQWKIENQ